MMPVGCSLVFRIPWLGVLCGSAGPRDREPGRATLHVTAGSSHLPPALHHCRASVGALCACSCSPVSAGSSGEVRWGTGLAGAGHPTLAIRSLGPWSRWLERTTGLGFLCLNSLSFVLASGWALRSPQNRKEGDGDSLGVGLGGTISRGERMEGQEQGLRRRLL